NFAIIQGNFCQTTQEINDAKNRTVSFKDVFNSWKRFSHQNNTRQPAKPEELTNWSYDEVTDTIRSTVNSSSLIGLVSRTKYSDWDLEVYLSSTNGDDDTVGIVLAFATDEVGTEHTLTALRSCGGNGFTWRIAVNHSNARSGFTTQLNISSEAGLAVKWGNGGYGGGSSSAGYTENANGGWNG